MLRVSPWARNALTVRQEWPEAVQAALGHRIVLSGKGPFVAQAPGVRIVDASPLAAVRRAIEALS